jgi:hypothetical protein
VVGGLSTLTLCLAAALLFALASIYGFQFCSPGGWRKGSRRSNGADGSPSRGTSKRSDMEVVLEMDRDNKPLPAIVTSRMAGAPSDSFDSQRQSMEARPQTERTSHTSPVRRALLAFWDLPALWPWQLPQQLL